MPPVQPQKPTATMHTESTMALEWEDPGNGQEVDTTPCGILAATSQWQVDIGPIIADLTKSTTQMSFPGFFTMQSGVASGMAVAGPSIASVPIAKDDGTTASAAQAADALAPPVATHWNCVGACGADAQMKPSVTLGALKADSWQRVRIRAGNGFGWGAWSLGK